MKLRYAMILFCILYVAGMQYRERRPGGSKNPHVWMSELAQPPNQYMPMEFDLNVGGKGQQVWCVDFCVRHSETRVMPCPVIKALGRGEAAWGVNVQTLGPDSPIIQNNTGSVSITRGQP